MKKILKTILISSIALTSLVGVSVGATLYINNKDSLNNEIKGVVTTEKFSVTKHGYTLNVDPTSKNNVTFEVSKGNKIWKSSYLDPNDESIVSNSNKYFATSFISVGYLYNTSSISVRSLNDETKASRTTVSISQNEDGFSASIRMADLNLSLLINVKMMEKGLKISVPYSQIKENIKDFNKDNRLAYLTILPFFNSSYGLKENGFIMIPDGSGALIDLGKNTVAHKPFVKSVYDEDMGISNFRKNSTSTSTLSLPMYAINDNDVTTITSINKGSEYSKLYAYSKGISNDYNYCYFQYLYRDVYQKFNGIDDSKFVGKGQDEKNNFDIDCDYLLFSDEECGTPSEVATTYRSYLSSAGYLVESNNVETGLRIQFLMGENKNSMFGRTLVKMSDVSFVKETVSKIKEYAGNDIDISLLGYEKGGLTNSYPNHLGVESSSGGYNGYKDLGHYLVNNNIDYSFQCNYVKGYLDSAVGDSEKAMSISEKYIVNPDIHQGATASFLHLTLDKTSKKIIEESKEFMDLNATNLDFESIGNTLFSSHYNQKFSRQEAKEKYMEIIKGLYVKANLYTPNFYMLKYLNNYLDTPLKNNDFLIETSSFPLIQMILSGKNKMYSEAINLNYLGVDQILNMIDYNVNPTFLLTENDPLDLFMTNSEYIFTSSYDVWKDDVKSIYLTINNILKEVKGASLIEHSLISEKFYKNVYSNGKTIFVNYNDNPVTDDVSKVTLNGKEAKVF